MKVNVKELELYDTEFVSELVNEEYQMTIIHDAGKYWEVSIVVDVKVKGSNTFDVVEILDGDDNEFEPSNLTEVKTKLAEIINAEVEAIHEGKYSTQGAW